jgi:hypothetical protein
MEKLKYKLSLKLVWLANLLVNDKGSTPATWPRFRAVDSPDEALTGSKYACAAYSYEGLKSLTEQDGPNGFGATATIKWLISDEGWKDTSDMSMNEIRRDLAMSGIDLEEAE